MAEAPHSPHSSENESESISISNFPFSLSSLSPFYNTSPSSILNGCKRGFGNIVIGLSLSTALIVAAPIQGVILGYNAFGFMGATGGFFAGSLVGALGAVGITLYGVSSCLWYTGMGIWRTPSAVIAMTMGKRWDDDAEQWLHYDLVYEANKLLSVSDEEFVTMITKDADNQRITPQVFYTQCLVEDVPTTISLFSSKKHPNVSENGLVEDKKQARVVVKKNVMDRELYDVLGIEPEAGPSEIKKAYYIKARENHPDRNLNNAAANANFQKIGQAYQVLADPKLRHAYDTKGKSAIEGQHSLEASTIYTLVFGSEDFEHIIGELQLATKVKFATEKDKKPSELLRFRQRKRELQLAVLLAAKLDVYAVDRDEQLFTSKCVQEAAGLCESPLGAALLGLIAFIYKEKACSHLSTAQYLSFTAYKVFSGWANSLSSFSYTVSSAFAAWELRKLKVEAEKRQKEEDDKNNVPLEEREARAAKEKLQPGMNGIADLFGPNPTPEHKQKVRNHTKILSSNLIGLLWEVTKGDISSTLRIVCNKVLRDHSVTSETLSRRSEALLILAEEFKKNSADEKNGLQDFITKMGSQTGLYGDDVDANAEKANEDKDNIPVAKEVETTKASAMGFDYVHVNSVEELRAAIANIDTFSVKQLKQLLIELGNESKKAEMFVEKKELKECVLKQLTEQLRILEQA